MRHKRRPVKGEDKTVEHLESVTAPVGDCNIRIKIKVAADDYQTNNMQLY